MPPPSMPKPVQRSSWTDEYSYTEGVFDISQIPIRYFLTSIPLAYLDHCFRLVEDIPGSESWGYNAIFQRDIDEDRVKEELLDEYLLVKDKFKFFNPLTIALLPFDHDDQKILNNYRDPKASKDEGDYVRETIDGIELLKVRDHSIGNIKWNTDKIVATAIDGQHRLSALMKYASSPPAGVNPTKSQIPVILLIFNHEKGEILKQVREIFVDINKTARPVSRQRAILLDDRDIYAILSRDLVQDNVANKDGLPYEVVDWRRESLKPDADHQLTSMLVLYQCVERMFSNRVQTIEAYLQVNEALQKQQLEKIDFKARECVMTNRQAEVVLERFRPRHKQFLLTVFRGLDPFKAFLELFRKHIDAPNGKYLKEYLFKSDAKKGSVRERMKRMTIDDKAVIDVPIKELRAHKPEANLLFYSIGQRSLFHWFYRITALYRTSLSSLNLQAIADEYVKDLNFLNSLKFFDRDFQVDGKPVWEGLSVRSGRIIPSSASAERIGALTLLAITALRLEEKQEISDHIPEMQKIAYKKLLKALEPVMQTEELEEEEEDIEAAIAAEEDDDEDEPDEADEDAGLDETVDLRSMARTRLFSILRWIRDQKPVGKPKKKK